MDEKPFGVYDDLDNFDLGTQIHTLEGRNNTLCKHIETLANHVRGLNREIEQLKSTQENLKRNISELFKTAKTEIARKDRMIADLQQQLDDIILKRCNRADNRKRLTEDDASTKHTDNDIKRVKHNGKSEPRQLADVRADGHQRSSSQDDSRHKNDRRRDDRSWDYRDRDRPGHRGLVNYRDGPRNRGSRYRNGSRDRRGYRSNDCREDCTSSEHPRHNYNTNSDKRMDNRRHTENRPSSASGIDINDGKSNHKSTDVENKSNIEDKPKIEVKPKKEIRELEEGEIDVDNPTDNEEKEDCDSKDSHVSKVDLEAYVILERSTCVDNYEQDMQKEIVPLEQKKEIRIVEKPKEETVLTAKETSVANHNSANDKKVDNSNYMKNDNGNDVKNNISVDKAPKPRGTIPQELENVINSIKDEFLGPKVNENSVSVKAENTLPASNSNNSHIAVTNKINKSFRTKRRHCVITVNE